MHFPKKHLELAKVGEILETKNLKILNNVKTLWVSMLTPFKRVLQKYCPLLLKMAFDSPTNQSVDVNLELLLNVETLLGLACMVPFINVVKNLI